MALENKMKEKMTQTTSRQKVIMAVMVIVVLIIIWQIVGLVGNSSSASAPAPAIEPVAKMNASKPGEKEMKNTPGEATVSSSNNIPKTASGPQVDESLRQASLVNDPQFTRMQRITEEKYVGKLNELEELRIQRQIAETNQAIAAAKLATVTAEKDISDLLTKPSPNSLVYANQPVKTSVDVTPPTTLNPPLEVSTTPKIITPPPEEVPYKLLSVSMLFNKWSAVISLQNTMFSVSVGDVLPPDSSVVTNISKNSVTLRKNGKSRKVSISASF